MELLIDRIGYRVRAPLDGVLDLAERDCGLALDLLYLAIDFHFFRANNCADTLLDRAHRLIGYAFDLVASATPMKEF